MGCLVEEARTYLLDHGGWRFTAQNQLEAPGGPLDMTLTGHSGWVNSVCLLGDGRLASGSSDETIRIWDTQSGQCDLTLTGHSGGVRSVGVDGQGRLVSRDWNGVVFLWDLSSGMGSYVSGTPPSLSSSAASLTPSLALPFCDGVVSESVSVSPNLFAFVVRHKVLIAECLAH